MNTGGSESMSIEWMLFLIGQFLVFGVVLLLGVALSVGIGMSLVMYGFAFWYRIQGTPKEERSLTPNMQLAIAIAVSILLAGVFVSEALPRLDSMMSTESMDPLPIHDSDEP
jgi:uncharacterized membrane protein YidH (DUF202 family)